MSEVDFSNVKDFFIDKKTGCQNFKHLNFKITSKFLWSIVIKLILKQSSFQKGQLKIKLF